MTDARIKRDENDAAFQEELLRQMLLIRRFEEECGRQYGLRKFGGFCHLYIGQEAVAAGCAAALDLKTDYILTAYRDHGVALAIGMDSKIVMAELFAKLAGCSRGKGGSMHLFDAERHFFGGNGIVGAHVPLATGVGLKIKYRNEKAAVFCMFGDGAIHQGSFHESLNLARVWRLPVVYICENNHYGMGTDFQRVSAVTDFTVMAKSYDMPGKRVDGMDALAVYREANAAAERAREDSMPSLLELETYRYVGHSMSDPAQYRTREELDAYRKQDPILILKDRMLGQKTLTEERFQEMDSKAKALSEEAVRFAETAEEPPIATLYEDLLV